MKALEAFTSPDLAQGLVDKMACHTQQPLVFMEFCGGHTVEIIKSGIRSMLPQNIRLLSGPGCPVCVTDISDIDKAVAAAKIPGVIVVTFGDMLRVPGSQESLQDVRAQGGDVRVVYSASDAVDIALNNPENHIVFVAIGFETTAPTTAAAVIKAHEENLTNFYLIGMQKKCPPIIKEILNTQEVKLDGIIAPGHVSSVIGADPWDFIARDYGIACAVSGFEPLDILFAIERLCLQVSSGRPGTERVYRRGVSPQGNPTALAFMNRVFETTSCRWRGFGWVANSGLKLRPEFSVYDAEKVFDLETRIYPEPKNCICSGILRGLKTPAECVLFGRACRPEHPVGPCMVSSEGGCAAYLSYGGNHER